MCDLNTWKAPHSKGRFTELETNAQITGFKSLPTAPRSMSLIPGG